MLANLQLTNTAKYQVVTSNALGIVMSSMGSLTVSSVSSAVNNIITSRAAHEGITEAIAFAPFGRHEK